MCPENEILRYLDTIRRDLYTSFLENLDEYQRIVLLKSAGSLLELNWLIIEPGSRLCDHTIGELGIRTRTGASVVGVVRSGNLYTNPGPDFLLAQGDMAAIIGKSEQFNALQKLAGRLVL